MKVGNLHRTFNSREVGSKCLEDKGTVKQPLPLLRSVKLLDYRNRVFGTCHTLIFWLCRPVGFPQESNMQIRKSLKGDDYFKWYRLLMAIVENHGECTIPFGNPRDSAHSNLQQVIVSTRLLQKHWYLVYKLAHQVEHFSLNIVNQKPISSLI